MSEINKWFSRHILSSSTSQAASTKKTKKKKKSTTEAKSSADGTSNVQTRSFSIARPSSSRTFFTQSSKSFRRIFPQKKVTVYMAKKEPKVEKAKEPDEESYGSWQKGPEYRHLLPVYRPKKRIFWSTTEIAKRFPRCEESIQMSLSELIINCCFITVLLTVAFDMKPTVRFHYQNFLFNSLTRLEMPNYKLDLVNVRYFKDIRVQSHMFQFMKTALISNPFMDWFYERYRQKRILRNMLPTYYILGLPRVHQWRIPTNTCIISDSVSLLIEDCYDSFSYAKSWKRPIPVQNLNNFMDTKFPSMYKKEYWQWNKPKDYSIENNEYFAYIQTEMNNYPDGGFWFLLKRGSKREENNSLLLDAHHAFGWVRRETRAVIAEFVVYNPNVNLLTSVKLIFEFLPSGGIWPTVQLKTTKMFHLVTEYDYFIFGFITALAAFLCLHIIEECREIVFFKIRYLFRFWSWVDMCIIAAQSYGFYNLGFVLVNLKVAMDSYCKDTINQYVDMDELVYRDNIHDNCIIVVMFFAIYKLFRYVDYYGNVDIFTRTIANGGFALLTFTIRFSLIFFSYAQLGFFLFGSYNEQYSTRLRAILTLLRMYYGYFDYKRLTALQPVLGGFYFMGCIVLLIAMCTSFFLVVLYNYFSIYEAVVVIQKGTSAWGMICVLCRKAHFWIFVKRRKEKLPESNITYAELIETLEIMEFTRPEIDLLVRKYELIEKHTLDPAEVSRIIPELQAQVRASIRKVDNSQGRELDKSKKIPKVKPLTYKQYRTLRKRLDSLEVQTEMCTERVVRVLHVSQRGRRLNYVAPKVQESDENEDEEEVEPPPPPPPPPEESKKKKKK